jgi:hypothetical protein
MIFFSLCTGVMVWFLSICNDPVRFVTGYHAAPVHLKSVSSLSVDSALLGTSTTKLSSFKSYSSEYSHLDSNATIRQREIEMAIGKAADTLRKDYPNILKCCPNYEIYDPDVELVDPSGVTLHGLGNYKRTYGILRTIVNFLYDMEESGLTFRLLYDFSTKSIRVIWHAVLIPKPIYGGYARRVHIDGISVYEMDRTTGLICKHRLDRTCLNNIPIQYPQGIWNALHTQVIEPNGIPVGVGIPAGGYWRTDNSPLPFLPSASSRLLDIVPTLSGASMACTTTTDVPPDTTSDGSDEAIRKDSADFMEQLERRNRSRAKFGLKPLSPEEFVELEQEVRELESKQREKLAANKRQQQQQSQQAVSYSSPKIGLLDKIFADVIPDKCESNEDCERPLVCCDFIFKKICCASGVPVGYGQMRPALIPVPARPDTPSNF